LWLVALQQYRQAPGYNIVALFRVLIPDIVEVDVILARLAAQRSKS
jgi:hypothetical protein